MKVVIAGSKYDADDFLRLKLHEEYGRVWLYSADRFGNSVERILCIDDDGLIRIAANHVYDPETHEIRLTFPLSRRADMKHDSLNNKSVPEVPQHGVNCGTDEDFDGTNITNQIIDNPGTWRLPPVSNLEHAELIRRDNEHFTWRLKD